MNLAEWTNIYAVFNTEGILEVASKIWSDWDSNPWSDAEPHLDSIINWAIMPWVPITLTNFVKLLRFHLCSPSGYMCGEYI